MKAQNFIRYSNGHCAPSKLKVDQQTVEEVIKSARKRPMSKNAVIIARHGWLKRRKLQIPEDLELANLCLMFKDGKEYRAFYSNTMTHVIKKQNYHIQILN